MSGQFPETKKVKSVPLRLEELELRTLLSSAGAIAMQTGQYAQGHIIVQWNGAAPVDTSLSTSLQAIGNDTFDVYLQSGVTVTEAVSYYDSLANVAYAEPDYSLALAGSPVTPSDPNYSSQWNMTAISAPNAWAITTGSSNIVVAVIDTGIDYNQPDLVNNLWHNTDGSVGWNYIANDNNPYDDNGHGTAVAGVIGAEGNNGVGIAGVDWHVKLMSLKFMDSSGNGSTSNAASAIYFAVENGAKIINASWGGSTYDSALNSAISYAQQHGVIVVTAAGNNGTNNDTSAFYPADYNFNNLISVAATDQNGNLASYSNYGVNSVALAAPGSNILTTTPNDTFTYYSGTSLAAPEVAGALALVWGEHTSWSYTQVIDDVLASVDPESSLAGKVSTGGQLDLYKAVTYGETTTTPTASSSSATISGVNLSTTSVSEFRPTGTAIGTFSAGETGGASAVAYSLVSGSGSTNNADFTIVGNQLETAAIFDYSEQNSYSVRVQATTASGSTYDEVFTISILNVSALSRNGGTLTVSGTSGNDTFGFLGGAATDLFTLNGVTYAANAALISNIVFNGNGGNDTAYLNGTGTTTAVLTDSYDELRGSGFKAMVYGVATAVAYGSSGDTAYFYGGSGANTFVGTSTYSYLQGSNFINSANGFSTVVAYGTSGANNSAYFYDGSGSNTFVGASTESYLQGSNFINCVWGFQTVNAYETNSSSDTAYLYDGSGTNTLMGTASYTYLQGSNFVNCVWNFQTVVGYETLGSNDTAYLYDGTGTNTYIATGAYSYLQGSNFINCVWGFQVVAAYETSGTNDTAYLYDGAGSNTFFGMASYSYLEGSNFTNYACGFQTVWAIAGSGTDDTAYLYDAPGVNVFYAQSNVGYVDGNGLVYGMLGFNQVYLISTQSNQDSATIIGSLEFVLDEIGYWS